MVHERKDGSASVSKEKVQGWMTTSPGDPPCELDESSRTIGAASEHKAFESKPSSHNLVSPAKLDQESSKHSCRSNPEPRKADALEERREEKETNDPISLDLERSHHALQLPLGDEDIDSESASQGASDHDLAQTDADIRYPGWKPQKDKGEGEDLNHLQRLVVEKPSSDESSIKNLFSGNKRESTGSLLTPSAGGKRGEVPGFKTLSKIPSKRELELEESQPFAKSPEQGDCSKDDMSLSKEENQHGGANEYIDGEVTAMPPPNCDDERTQGNVQRDGKLDFRTCRAQEAKNRKETKEKTTLPNDPKEPIERVENEPDACDDDGVMDEGMVASSEAVETKESHPQDGASAQLASSEFQSLKEVSDLQQEILGDSDSDEESFTDERKPVSTLKRRSYSLPIPSNKKVKRMGACGSLETRGGTATEVFQKTTARDGSDQEPRMERIVGTEMQRTQLDPETMEAAAIAAQIEKEEATNRARRTTRLAAGKIRQVDYKASAVAQVPRSVSSGHGSEEIERNTNDNDFPAEATRTTRRRSISNQFYSSQRSSRRVAKLRSSQEKEHSSNDETENHTARTSSGGNESENRSDKEVVYLEDVEGAKFQGSRPSCIRPDARRGRTEPSMKRARHAYHDEGDHDSQGRAYSTRASTRENSVADAAEVTDLGDPCEFPSESEDLEDDKSIKDRCNEHGFTKADLKSIAEVASICGSVNPSVVVASLGEQDGWKAVDLKNQAAEAFLREMIGGVQSLSTSLSLTPRELNTGQVLSFLSAETWRLSTGGLAIGVPGKPTSLLKKAAREDQARSTLERSRRKEYRDVEEMRGTLEKEMESRRRAELDTLCVEIQASEICRASSREKARCRRVEQETEKFRHMEVDTRKKLERAKILVGQLQGQNTGSDGANETKMFHQDETLRIGSGTSGAFETSSIHAKTRSTTSEDVLEMMGKNITTTSQRLLEMDRLRVLIAAREAEAEEFQRICEKERMCFVSTLELKNRLETEIYLYRSHGAVAYCAGNSSVAPPSSRVTKESIRKGDNRVPSAYGNRSSGYARQRSVVGKNVSSVPLAGNHKNNVTASRPKSGIGKPSEASKLAKRKQVVKNGGSGSDKM